MATMQEFDDMTDEDFADFVYSRGRPGFSVSAEQRAEMVRAHAAWVETIDEEEQETVDWNTATHSDWDLYAELRMNGVDFERVREPEFAR